jgi:hypothetical protein
LIVVDTSAVRGESISLPMSMPIPSLFFSGVPIRTALLVGVSINDTGSLPLMGVDRTSNDTCCCIKCDGLLFAEVCVFCELLVWSSVNLDALNVCLITPLTTTAADDEEEEEDDVSNILSILEEVTGLTDKTRRLE